MEKLDYWRLCDELSIEQAAQLVIGVSPGWLRAGSEAEGTELYHNDLEAVTTAIPTPFDLDVWPERFNT
jgi:hypothetical protein